MKWKWIGLLTIVVACLGCAPFEETYYIDREFGKAQMQSWDKLIAHPDYRYVEKQPEGLDGINAEPAMDVYHRSFSKEPTRTNVIQFGFGEE